MLLAPGSRHPRHAAGHADGAHLGRRTCVLCGRRVENSVAWPLGFLCCPEHQQLQAPRLLRKLHDVYPLTGVRGRVLGETFGAEVLERPDGRWCRTPFHGETTVINELSVTAHAIRPPRVALRDELAREVAATWCWWSSALVTSARLAQTMSHRKSTYALGLSEGNSQPLRHHSSSSESSVLSALVIHEVGNPAGPTACHNLHLPRCPACGMERKCGKYRVFGAGQVGRKRSRPALQHTLWPTVHLARHVTARVVGGLAVGQGLCPAGMTKHVRWSIVA